MSRLLYDERPLVVNPQLAALIGLPEALILQQVHYWLFLNAQAGHNLRDGFYWTYNTYSEWAEQFPFYSRNTIIRTINRLERDGLLISASYNKRRGDRTKWYRIDYDRLTHLPKMSKWFTQNGETVSSDWANDIPGLGRALPETNAETPPKKPSEKAPARASQKAQKDGIVNEIFTEMRAYLGFPDRVEKDPIPNYGQEGQAIKRLLTRGYTKDEILTYWKARVDKARGFVTMVYINKDIGAPGSPGGNGKGKGHLPTDSALEARARELGLPQ